MKRKEVLPAWIRFFSWIFLFCGGFFLFIFLIGLSNRVPVSLSAYGLSYSGMSTLNLGASWIAFLVILGGLVGYGILWGRRWAIRLGIVQALLSLGNCIVVLWYTIKLGAPHIRLEPLLLIPFLIILFRRRKQWENFDPQPVPEQTIANDSTAPDAAV